MIYERESKYYVTNLAAVESRLQGVGARLVHPRTHEQNRRFDIGPGSLTETGQLLRLRKTDSKISVTYKGPFERVPDAGVNVRREIEFTASDFDAVDDLLKVLGFYVSFLYEKYRTTYQIGSVQVMLDETPIGSFVELEGSTIEGIEAVAALLGLAAQHNIGANYYDLFLRVIASHKLDIYDMTFERLADVQIKPEDLGVHPADA